LPYAAGSVTSLTMPKYRLVLFDSDGTLADTLPWFKTVFNQGAVQHGFKPMLDDEQEYLRGLTTREMLAHLRVPLWKMPRILTAMRKAMAEQIHEFSLFDGIAESLQRLAANGVVLGVVSSNSCENVRTILGPANAALIQHYACGASMFGKAAKLRTVLRASGVSPSKALYVGDEIRDAEAAHKVDMAYGAVAWGCHRLETLRAAGAAEFFSEPRHIGAKLG
jgi:phosphoglycolate phosphatase